MSEPLTVDPARVLQRVMADPIGRLYAEVAMRDVALADAHARIAELEKPEEAEKP